MAGEVPGTADDDELGADRPPVDELGEGAVQLHGDEHVDLLAAALEHLAGRLAAVDARIGDQGLVAA